MELAMTKPDPQLQGLADIQEPQLLNDWYFAPIWWLLALCIVLLSWWCVKRWRQRALAQQPRLFALKELTMIDVQQPTAPHQITTLLKRYLQTQAPQHPALTQSGLNWQQFLQQTTVQSTDVVLPDLLVLHYQATPLVDEVKTYAHFAEHWLLHHQPDLAGVRDA
jgi:hypothetical protein